MLVTDILRFNAARAHGQAAVIMGDLQISFGQLQERSHRLANALLGIAAKGDRVAILAENRPEYIDCYYGVPAAGMALTVLNYRLNPKEWSWILNNAEARVLVVENKFLEAIAAELDKVPSVRHVIVIGGRSRGAGKGKSEFHDYDGFLAAGRASAPDVHVDVEDVAWLLYTSGTTGFPKGAMLSHRNLTMGVLASAIELQPVAGERALVSFPLCHITGYAILLHHIRGGPVILLKMFEPELWLRSVEHYRIMSAVLAPTMYAMLFQHPKLGDYDLSSLITLGYGAAAMPVELLRTLIDRFGAIVYSGFGMTELCGNVLAHPKEAHIRAIRGEEQLLAACGRPMCLADVKVVDAQMNECPPGEVGEIVVQGEQVLKGYWRNEAGTRDAFAGGWFHTGDLARRDEEGFFYIVDRLKDMIISGAENVYSREVEEALYAHPAVAEVAVIGLPDPTWGERVTAVVVLRAGAAAPESDLIATCRSRLAGYKTPKQVIFTDALPKNTSGKILKREVRERYREQQSQPS